MELQIESCPNLCVFDDFRWRWKERLVLITEHHVCCGKYNSLNTETMEQLA